MDASHPAVQQEQPAELDYIAYAATREQVEAAVEQNEPAALDGLVAYLCRAIAMEHGATPVQADERGEACAALFTEVLAETNSHAHAMVAAVTRARITSV
jgi:hypothetical protein